MRRTWETRAACGEDGAAAVRDACGAARCGIDWGWSSALGVELGTSL